MRNPPPCDNKTETRVAERGQSDSNLKSACQAASAPKSDHACTELHCEKAGCLPTRQHPEVRKLHLDCHRLADQILLRMAVYHKSRYTMCCCLHFHEREATDQDRMCADSLESGTIAERCRLPTQQAFLSIQMSLRCGPPEKSSANAEHVKVCLRRASDEAVASMAPAKTRRVLRHVLGQICA